MQYLSTAVATKLISRSNTVKHLYQSYHVLNHGSRPNLPSFRTMSSRKISTCQELENNEVISSSDVPVTSSANTNTPLPCIPCASLDPSAVVSDERVEDFLKSSPLWTRKMCDNEKIGDGKSAITRTIVAVNFQRALNVVNAVGCVAERLGHHPNLHLTGYRNVEVVLFTHKLGGISENDLTLAQLLDEAVQAE